MKIYLSHKESGIQKKDFEESLRNDQVLKEHHFVISGKRHDEKEIIMSCNAAIFDASHPSTKTGIELGWAHAYRVPIILLRRLGDNEEDIHSLKEKLIAYDTLLSGIKEAIKLIERKGENESEIRCSALTPT